MLFNLPVFFDSIKKFDEQLNETRKFLLFSDVFILKMMIAHDVFQHSKSVELCT